MGKISVGPKGHTKNKVPNSNVVERHTIEKIIEVKTEQIDLSPIFQRLLILESKAPQIPVELTSLEDRINKLENKEELPRISIKETVMDNSYIDMRLQKIEDLMDYNDNTSSARLSTKQDRKESLEFKDNMIAAFEDLKADISYLKSNKNVQVIEKENKFIKPLIIINLVLMVLSLIQIIGGN